MKVIHQPGATRLVIGRDSNTDMTLSYTPIYELTNPTTQLLDVKDSTVLTDTSASSTINAHVNISKPISHLYDGDIFESLTPSLASVETHGNVVALSTGIATIRVSSTGFKSRTISVPVSVGQPFVTSTYQNYITGSVADHIRTNTFNLVSGKTAGLTTQRRWVNNHWNDSSGVLNTQSFTAGLDLTALDAYTGNSTSTNSSARVTLISPQHIIGANHLHPDVNPGNVVAFLDKNGTLVTRTIISSYYCFTNGAWPLLDMTGDIIICLLDSPIDTNLVKPMKVLPSNWRNYIPGMKFDYIPVLHLNNAVGINPELFYINTWAGSTQTSYPSLFSFWQNGRNCLPTWAGTGASSSPTFLVINNEPVLAMMTYVQINNWERMAGPAISDYITDINAAMARLSTANNSTVYTLSEIDLSGFPVY